MLYVGIYILGFIATLLIPVVKGDTESKWCDILFNAFWWVAILPVLVVYYSLRWASKNIETQYDRARRFMNEYWLAREARCAESHTVKTRKEQTRISSKAPVAGDKLLYDGTEWAPTGGKATIEEEAMAEVDAYLKQHTL